MPSTYSNLKIQLMATGENTTTWGNVTNVNLGTALEEAIAASADVTFASNNQTLTLTDTNATQVARHLRLRCAGTTGGSTRNLVVPNIEKPYLVQNDCADSIVVKTSAGTGITVPAGKTMWVYADGTNVVDAVTHLTSVTLGTALAVASGGTGANSATDARTNLGLGSIATQNSNSVTITGGSISGITDLAVADGGTGASDASGARTNLGLGSIATQNSNSVTITGGSISGITDLAVADGGTGASDASGARTNLGLGSMATQNANSVTITGGTLTGITSANITSANITGGSISGITDLAVADGGTGASDASGARTNLGLGSIATQNSNSVTITGGSISGITDLAVADGGTGASDASGARTNLGAAASGANTDITSLSPSGGLQVGTPTGGAQGNGTLNATGLFINGVAVGTGSGSVTSVALSGGTTGLTVSGSPITTSGTITLAGTLAVANGGTGSTDASGARTALGLGSIATQNSSSVTITGGSISGITDLAVADGGTGASDASGARTNLGATTVGGNLFTLTNPSAVRFIRVNADNTVSALSDSDFRTAIGAGTVTSVALSGGTTGLTVSGSPITTSGTITLAGTLAVANGGTGATTLTGVVIGNGTSAFTVKTNPSGAFVGTTDTQTLTSKTLSTGNTLDAGTSVSDTGTIAATSPGFRGIPQESKTSGYTLALTDAGKHISITTGGITIPANGSVAFPVGSAVVVYNNSGSTQSIAITTDTLRLAGTATTGTLTLAVRGLVTLIKVASTEWVASGNVS